MNTYTLDPPKPESTAVSAPTPPMAAPVYAPSTYQYPHLEIASASTPMVTPGYLSPSYQYPKPAAVPAAGPAPMMAPMYMPPMYQYPPSNTTAVTAPAPMATPVYMPASYQHPPYQNPAASNVPPADTRKIRDWLIWSIISLFVGGFIIGFLPLIFSLVCRSKKRRNNISGARTMSTLALVFNIIITIMGVLSIVSLVVYLIVYSQTLRMNEFYGSS